MYFVYINFNGKIFPQKWQDEKVNSETGKAYDTIQKIKLEDKHKGMSLDELKFTFPYKLE